MFVIAPLVAFLLRVECCTGFVPGTKRSIPKETERKLRKRKERLENCIKAKLHAPLSGRNLFKIYIPVL
jgi:hypothetical protein